MATSIVQTVRGGADELDLVDALTKKADHLDALTTMLSCAPQQFRAINEQTQGLILDLVADLAREVRDASSAVARAQSAV